MHRTPDGELPNPKSATKNSRFYPQVVDKGVDKQSNCLQNTIFLLNALAL
jgi:hypothetical protein